LIAAMSCESKIITALRCRQAAAFKSCVDAIACSKQDTLYPLHRSTVAVADAYAYICKNESLSGCTALTLQERMLPSYAAFHVVLYNEIHCVFKDCP